MFSLIQSRPGCWLLAVIAVAIAATWGCGRTGPARGAVQGHVTVGGQPLAHGRILFLPQTAEGGPVVTAAIQDGHYVLSSSEGPTLGLHRVEVEGELKLGFALDDEQAYAQRKGAPLPPNPIPPQFNQQSTLSTVIKAGENVFDVAIPAAVH